MSANRAQRPSALAGGRPAGIVVVARVARFIGYRRKRGSNRVAGCGSAVRRDGDGTLVGSDGIGRMMGEVGGLNGGAAGIVGRRIE